MASVYEATMQVILGRLQGSPPLCDNVRRSHKVAVPREDAPAIYLAEGDDEPKGEANDCETRREFEPIVRVFVREDDGYAEADELVLEAVDRLDPQNGPSYPNGVTVDLDRVTVAEEIADGDALRKDIHLRVRYKVPYWSLAAAT